MNLTLNTSRSRRETHLQRPWGWETHVLLKYQKQATKAAVQSSGQGLPNSSAPLPVGGASPPGSDSLETAGRGLRVLTVPAAAR